MATRMQGLEKVMKEKLTQLKVYGVDISSNVMADEDEEMGEPIVLDTGMFSVKVKTNEPLVSSNTSFEFHSPNNSMCSVLRLGLLERRRLRPCSLLWWVGQGTW